MITKEKLFYTRVLSAALLVILTVVLVIYMDRMLELSIVTANESLPYVYSDAELPRLPVPQDDGADIMLALEKADKKYDIGEDFLDYFDADANIDPYGTFLSDVKRRIESSGYSDDIWADLTGYTFSVLYDIYTGTAYDDEKVTLLGDIYDQRKTTVLISTAEIDGGVSDNITAARDEAGVLVSGKDEVGVRYYISGGLKLSVIIGDDTEAVKTAKSQSDIALAVVADADAAVKAVESGADAVVAVGGDDTVIEYHNGVPIVYGFRTYTEGGAYMTLTLSVGITPILRYYPCGVTDGMADTLTGEAMSAAIEALNARSDSAVIGDDNRIKEK